MFQKRGRPARGAGAYHSRWENSGLWDAGGREFHCLPGWKACEASGKKGTSSFL